MNGAELAALPLAGHMSLFKTMSPQNEVEAKKMERISYASSVESLICAIVCCRLDLEHVVSQVSKFMAHPRKEHWRALKGVFKYLVGTVGVEICYRQQGDNERSYNMSKEAQG